MLFHISKVNTHNFSDVATAESTEAGKQSKRRGKRIIFLKSVSQLCNWSLQQPLRMHFLTALCSWLCYHCYEILATHSNTTWTDPMGNIELLEGFSGGVFLAYLSSLCQVNILIVDCPVTSNRHSILAIFKALCYLSPITCTILLNLLLLLNPHQQDFQITSKHGVCILYFRPFLYHQNLKINLRDSNFLMQ